MALIQNFEPMVGFVAKNAYHHIAAIQHLDFTAGVARCRTGRSRPPVGPAHPRRWGLIGCRADGDQLFEHRVGGRWAPVRPTMRPSSEEMACVVSSRYW